MLDADEDLACYGWHILCTLTVNTIKAVKDLHVHKQSGH